MLESTVSTLESSTSSWTEVTHAEVHHDATHVTEVIISDFHHDHQHGTLLEETAESDAQTLIHSDALVELSSDLADDEPTVMTESMIEDLSVPTTSDRMASSDATLYGLEMPTEELTVSVEAIKEESSDDDQIVNVASIIVTNVVQEGVASVKEQMEVEEAAEIMAAEVISAAVQHDIETKTDNIDNLEIFGEAALDDEKYAQVIDPLKSRAPPSCPSDEDSGDDQQDVADFLGMQQIQQRQEEKESLLQRAESPDSEMPLDRSTDMPSSLAPILIYDSTTPVDMEKEDTTPKSPDRPISPDSEFPIESVTQTADDQLLGYAGILESEPAVELEDELLEPPEPELIQLVESRPESEMREFEDQRPISQDSARPDSDMRDSSGSRTDSQLRELRSSDDDRFEPMTDIPDLERPLSPIPDNSYLIEDEDDDTTDKTFQFDEAEQDDHLELTAAKFVHEVIEQAHSKASDITDDQQDQEDKPSDQKEEPEDNYVSEKDDKYVEHEVHRDQPPSPGETTETEAVTTAVEVRQVKMQYEVETTVTIPSEVVSQYSEQLAESVEHIDDGQLAEDIPEITVTQHLHKETLQEDYPTSYYTMVDEDVEKETTKPIQGVEQVEALDEDEKSDEDTGLAIIPASTERIERDLHTSSGRSTIEGPLPDQSVQQSIQPSHQSTDGGMPDSSQTLSDISIGLMHHPEVVPEEPQDKINMTETQFRIEVHRGVPETEPSPERDVQSPGVIAYRDDDVDAQDMQPSDDDDDDDDDQPVSDEEIRQAGEFLDTGLDEIPEESSDQESPISPHQLLNEMTLSTIMECSSSQESSPKDNDKDSDSETDELVQRMSIVTDPGMLQSPDDHGDSSSVDSFTTVVAAEQEDEEEDRMADFASMTSSFHSDHPDHFEEQPQPVFSIDVRDKDVLTPESSSNGSEKFEFIEKSDIDSPVLVEKKFCTIQKEDIESPQSDQGRSFPGVHSPIARGELFSRMGDPDNISLASSVPSSLAEFEQIEREIDILGTFPKIGNSKSGERDDVSISSSLAEFERLESEIQTGSSNEKITPESQSSAGGGSLSSLAEFELIEKDIEENRRGSLDGKPLTKTSQCSSMSSLREFEQIEQALISEEVESEAQRIVTMLESGELPAPIHSSSPPSKAASITDLEKPSGEGKDQVEGVDPDSIGEDSESGSHEIEKIIQQASLNVESFQDVSDGRLTAKSDDVDSLDGDPDPISVVAMADYAAAQQAVSKLDVDHDIDADSLQGQDDIESDKSKSESVPTAAMQSSADSIDGSKQFPDDKMSKSGDSSSDKPGLTVVIIPLEKPSYTMESSVDSLTDVKSNVMESSVDSLTGEKPTDDVMAVSVDSLTGPSYPEVMVASADSLTGEKPVSDVMMTSTDSLSDQVVPGVMEASTDSLTLHRGANVMEASTDSLEQPAEAEMADCFETDSLQGGDEMQMSAESFDFEPPMTTTSVDIQRDNIMFMSVESGAWSQTSSTYSDETIKSSATGTSEIMQMSMEEFPGHLEQIKETNEYTESMTSQQVMQMHHVHMDQGIRSFSELDYPQKSNPFDKEGNYSKESSFSSSVTSHSHSKSYSHSVTTKYQDFSRLTTYSERQTSLESNQPMEDREDMALTFSKKLPSPPESSPSSESAHSDDCYCAYEQQTSEGGSDTQHAFTVY
ncbi:uncharacterized protein LOC141904102 [Tubulanus polymorphus]|uniref:uncharacterized protein LOC141904102 n=1 Tax=Tubulanus polymorphus TaxID=672921 RepID=UPI003DA4CA6F